MDQNLKTRFSLLEKIKDPHDAEAWNEFTSIYYPVIFGICRSKGLQHADATDISQEVLSRVADAIDSYRPNRSNSSFRGWLYRITRNLTVDFFRRRSKDPLAIAAAAPDLNQIREPSAVESQEFQLAFRKQMFAVVAKAVETQVAPKTWQVFWLTEVERKSIEDVAIELDISTGAIYVARSRVIAKLRKEVQKRMHETSQYFVNPDAQE